MMLTATCKFCRFPIGRDDAGCWVDETDGDGCSGDDECRNENEPHVPIACPCCGETGYEDPYDCSFCEDQGHDHSWDHDPDLLIRDWRGLHPSDPG